MELVIPSAQYQASYLSYLEELGEEERYPFTLDIEFSDFHQLLAQLNDYSLGKNLPEGAVQNSTLWLIDANEIIGVTNVRHFLNERIAHCGGHIGLGIRPSCRGKNLGKQLMQLSIDYLINLGVMPIDIHCYKSNLASAKVIQYCGGVLDSEITEGDQIVQRYRVTVDT